MNNKCVCVCVCGGGGGRNWKVGGDERAVVLDCLVARDPAETV